MAHCAVSVLDDPCCRMQAFSNATRAPFILLTLFTCHFCLLNSVHICDHEMRQRGLSHICIYIYIIIIWHVFFNVIIHHEIL